MASDIAKSIEGVRGALAGHPAHEEISQHLDRVYQLASRGRKDSADDSPGRREAASVAHQKEIPSERSVNARGGNEVSNSKGSVSYPDRPPTLSEDHGDEQGHLNHAGPVRSGGGVISNLIGPKPTKGQVPFRTVAAGRGAIKEPSKTSAGNARTNDDGVKPPTTPTRVGNAPAPSKARGEGNTGRFAKEPGYVGKEQLGKNTFERAAQGVRERFAAAKNGRNG